MNKSIVKLKESLAYQKMVFSTMVEDFGIDNSTEITDQFNVVETEIYNIQESWEETKEELENYALNELEHQEKTLLDFIPEHLKNIRYALVLEKLVENIEHIPIEKLEALANNQELETTN